MPYKAFLLLYLTIFLLFFNTNIHAEKLKIIPLKKPTLENKVIKKKIVQGILKPKPKPTREDKKEKEIITKIEKKEKEKKVRKKLGILLPKSKPLIVKKEKDKSKEKSKYFRHKDYILAKRAVQEMEKRKWDKALKIAKKAKDKSIYNFIQWRHLLTKGNLASFYDYQQFISKNENYPRINRIRYLAEHKLSTEKISSKKIINWFGEKEPLSGFGKLILGESHIINGNKTLGIKLIKEGWITADLSRSQMKFLRKKFKKYLTANDYIKRADYLAWENKYWDLKRMLRYLPKDHQLLYTARQILMSKSYGVDNAIAKVPTKFKNDAGLNYDRLKWRRKRGRVDSSLEILLKILTQLVMEQFI